MVLTVAVLTAYSHRESLSPRHHHLAPSGLHEDSHQFAKTSQDTCSVLATGSPQLTAEAIPVASALRLQMRLLMNLRSFPPTSGYSLGRLVRASSHVMPLIALLGVMPWSSTLICRCKPATYRCHHHHRSKADDSHCGGCKSSTRKVHPLVHPTGTRTSYKKPP